MTQDPHGAAQWRPATLVRSAAGPLALGAALGALGGWLWWTWWGPAPDGKVFDTQAGPAWYPQPLDAGVTRDFSGTATYVVVGVTLAVLLGLVAAWVARDAALVGLGSVAVASVMAAAAMWLIGTQMSPPDPQDRAGQVEIGTELPGNLAVSGWTPYLVWPAGALIGYSTLLLSLPLGGPGASGGSGRPEHLSVARAPRG